MNTATRYWTLVRLNSAGRSKVDELPTAKAFFHQQIDQTLEHDTVIQKQLLNLARNGADRDRISAALCLRCFISHQIEQVCIQLDTQFGEYYGFTRYDLFPFVLDDDGKERLAISDQPFANSQQPTANSYHSLSLKILQTFDPDRANLTTWTIRLVKHHHELNAFLLEHGLCMLSDWAILNDTTPKKLRRVLTQFHHQTKHEVEQAAILLESYHAIYRRDRILQGQRGACLPPTAQQLNEIRDRVQQQTRQVLSPDTLLTHLHALADCLRQYRISRGGQPPSQSLDHPGVQHFVDQASQNASNSLEEDPQTEFLQTYRQQFLVCLEHVLVQVISNRLQTLKLAKHQIFLTALQLFYCQGLTMAAIAQQIELQAQFQVTRLLSLKALRADVRHWMLQCLRSAVRTSALDYVEPNELDKLDNQINAALQEQVDTLIQDDQTSAKTPKSYVSKSLFAQNLCRYLDQLVANSQQPVTTHEAL